MNMNGEEACNVISDFAKEDTLKDKIKLVITDIEMPKMDGHRLTKLIKEQSKTSFLPVIIFSSMISDEMARKGEGLGAENGTYVPMLSPVGELDRLILK